MNYGIDVVEVTDNGSGIEPADYQSVSTYLEKKETRVQELMNKRNELSDVCTLPRVSLTYGPCNLVRVYLSFALLKFF